MVCQSWIRPHPCHRLMLSHKPSKVDLAYCLMYCPPTSQHGFPLNCAYRSYHTCVCSLIINRSFTLLFSCYMCNNLAHRHRSLHLWHCITLYKTMNFSLHYSYCSSHGYGPGLNNHFIFKHAIHVYYNFKVNICRIC